MRGGLVRHAHSRRALDDPAPGSAAPLPMTIADAYGPKRFGLSFELFPPKTAEALGNLEHHVGELVKFSPSFITCTYGAGGSTQDRTLEVIGGVRERHRLPVATHLTCVGRTPAELAAYLSR